MSDAQEQKATDDASELSQEDRQKIDVIFTNLVSDTNGFIDAEELKFLFRALGQNPTDNYLKKLIESLDKYSGRKDGLLDKDEFIDFIKNEYGPLRTPEQEQYDIYSAFQVFDQNGDGYITATELHRVLTAIGECPLSLKDAEELIKEVDIDEDGRISYAEFTKKMTATSLEL